MIRESLYDKEEVARRGTEMYRGLVNPQLRAEDKGKLVAIDVETGAFEVADTMHAACRHLRERFPDAQICTLCECLTVSTPITDSRCLILVEEDFVRIG